MAIMWQQISIFLVVLFVSDGSCDGYGGGTPSTSNLPTDPTPIAPPAAAPAPPPPAPAETPPATPAAAPAPPPPAPAETPTAAPAPPPSPPAETPPATPTAAPPAIPPAAPAEQSETAPAEQSETPPAAPPSTPPSTTPDSVTGTGGDNNVTGMWYAVMSTGCSDSGPCNIFTNNKDSPCKCISQYFRPLQTNGYQVFINAVNNQTASLTVDMGGASPSSSDNKDFKCFTYSRAVMPLSVVQATKYTITDNVCGYGNFLKYDFSIIGYSNEAFYMITKLKIAGGSELIVIWCRKRFPSRKDIWTKIVQNLKALNINDHDLSFIGQEGCTYPSLNQYDEMFFCS